MGSRNPDGEGSCMGLPKYSGRGYQILQDGHLSHLLDPEE